MTLEEYNLEKDTLMHYGIIGMKWGYRRYQNGDGTLTPAGRKRYGIGEKIGKQTDTLKSMQYKLEKYQRSGKDKKYQKTLAKSTKLAEKIADNKSKYDILADKEERQERKLDKYITKQQKVEARHAVKDAKKQEKKIEELLRSGDKKNILKNIEKFDDNQVRNVLSRLENEKRLKDFGKKEFDFAASAQKFTKNIGAAMTAYDEVEKVVKKFDPSEKAKRREKDAIIKSLDIDKIRKNSDKLSVSDMEKALGMFSKADKMGGFYAGLSTKDKYLESKKESSSKTSTVSVTEPKSTDSPKVEATKKELKAEAKAIDKKLKELAKADVTSYGFESKSDAALKMVKKYNNDLHDLESATGFHLAPITKATQDKIAKDTTYAMKWMGNNKAYTNASYTSVADSVNKGGTYDFTSILREVGTVKANDIKIDSYLGGFDGSKSTERGYDKRYKMKF